MTNEDGSLVMVFNGEIYNSPELRRYCEAKGHRFSSSMDGEVILHLWEMEGPAALARLNGIFAVAIASTRSGEMTLARDPVGVKPLVYSLARDNTLWFASELKALAAAGAPIGGYDLVALAQFLTFLWVPDPRTPFSGAKSLEPGQALQWTPRGMNLFSYCAPLVPPAERLPLSPGQAVVELRERFGQAARRQLMADVPIGLMASGGVDSGLLWWATQDALRSAYTIEWAGGSGNERLEEDVRAVRELERRFGTSVDFLPGEEAEHVLLPPSGDLFADPAYELTRLIAQSARERGFKVLLSGQGGDELFAGYRRHRVAPLVGRLRLGPAGSGARRLLGAVPIKAQTLEYMARILRASSQAEPFRAYMELCSYSSSHDRARALDCTEAEVSEDVVWQRHREVFERLPTELSFPRKAIALDFCVYLPGLGLAYVDRAGMEFGVEIRVPWLDLELVRWALRLPDGMVARRRRGKWLPRQLAARELSPGVAYRPKRAFAAPATRVDGGAGVEGEYRFRQGSYFARARQALRLLLAAPPLEKRL